MSDNRRRPNVGRNPAAVLDKIKQLRAVAVHDDYDPLAWEQVVTDLNSLPLLDATRQAYEELLSVFPSASTQWTRYVEAEISGGNLNAAKSIFGRCLLNCPSIELFTQYLRFVKQSNTGQGASGVAQVRDAYEFALDILGTDMYSGPLWQEYINVLQSPKVGSDTFRALYPNTLQGQEDSAKFTAMRKAFQRAVVVPSYMLETLWKQYEQFENSGMNRMLAKKILDEFRPRFQAARSTFRDKRRKVEALSLALLPLPPGKGGLLQEQQAFLWADYLEFEKSNPQNLEQPNLTQRLQLAYDQCLTCLWFHPEIWYDCANWHLESGGGAEKASAVLTKGISALPSCLLLRFALADLEELGGRHEVVKQIYQGLVDQLESEAAEATAAAANGASLREQQLIPQSLGTELGALVWIQYMRYLRRSGDAMGSRQLFIRARKWANSSLHVKTPWQVYAAAALMEWQMGRDGTVAAKIFEKGLEDPRLSKEPELILEYHTLLMDMGDVDNARALFERAFSEQENVRCAKLWERYVTFEYNLGNVSAAVQVERRYRQALLAETQSGADSFPKFSLAAALSKYSFHRSVPCTDIQKQHLFKVLGTEPDEGVPSCLASRGAGSRLTGVKSSWSTIGSSSDPLPFNVKSLLMDLPPPQAMDGLPCPVEQVMEVLLSTDLSAAAITQACLDLEAKSGSDVSHPLGPNRRFGVPWSENSAEPHRREPLGQDEGPSKRMRGDVFEEGRFNDPGMMSRNPQFDDPQKMGQGPPGNMQGQFPAGPNNHIFMGPQQGQPNFHPGMGGGHPGGEDGGGPGPRAVDGPHDGHHGGPFHGDPNGFQYGPQGPKNMHAPSGRDVYRERVRLRSRP